MSGIQYKYHKISHETPEVASIYSFKGSLPLPSRVQHISMNLAQQRPPKRNPVMMSSIINDASSMHMTGARKLQLFPASIVCMGMGVEGRCACTPACMIQSFRLRTNSSESGATWSAPHHAWTAPALCACAHSQRLCAYG